MNDELEIPSKGKLFKWGLYALLAFSALSIISYGMGWVGEAAKVAKQEVGPQAALQKYEWFKDASKQIERLKQDITMYEKKVERGCSNTDGSTYNLQSCMLWEQEAIGVRSQYNNLVAKYNAASAKFNWSLFKAEDTDIPVTYESH